MSLLVLNIDSTLKELAWQKSQSQFKNIGKHRAYIHQLALIGLKSWLESDEDFPSVLEIVNTEMLEQVDGTILEISNKRLILIATEYYDTSELRVPQEWVDIQSLAGDYYVAMQVDLEEEEIIIWGYETHQTLKEKGSYTPRDRTYSLETAQLILDPDVLWITLELGLQAQTKAHVDTIPTLNTEALNNLVIRLGNPNLVFPRQEVSFQEWAGLVESEHHFKQWFELRQK